MAFGGGEGDDVLAHLSGGCHFGDGVLRVYAARVVVATGARPAAEADATGGGAGVLAQRGIAVDGLVGGGNKASLAVDPQRAATEVDDKLDDHERVSLVDGGDIVVGKWVFPEGEDELMGTKWYCRGSWEGGRDRTEEEEREEWKKRSHACSNSKELFAALNLFCFGLNL